MISGLRNATPMGEKKDGINLTKWKKLKAEWEVDIYLLHPQRFLLLLIRIHQQSERNSFLWQVSCRLDSYRNCRFLFLLYIGLLRVLSVPYFYNKLLLLKDEMNTETAKEIAEERHAYLLGFVKKLEEEITS